MWCKFVPICEWETHQFVSAFSILDKPEKPIITQITGWQTESLSQFAPKITNMWSDSLNRTFYALNIFTYKKKKKKCWW